MLISVQDTEFDHLGVLRVFFSVVGQIQTNVVGVAIRGRRFFSSRYVLPDPCSPANERTLRAQSTYTKAADGTLTIAGTPAPYTYSAYGRIIDNHIYTMSERDEMIKECHLALLKTQAHAERVPDFVYNVLYAYIVKYVYR